VRNSSAPSLSVSADESRIMLSWQAEQESGLSGGGGLGKVSGPPPVSWFQQVYTRCKPANGNWGTLTCHEIPDKEGVFAKAGSVNNDFSLLWKVKDEDIIHKQDYICGTGWDMYSQLESFSASDVKDPQISSNSDRSMALWSTYNSAPYLIDYKNFTSHPGMTKTASVDACNYTSRESCLPLSTLAPELKGYVTLKLNRIFYNDEDLAFSDDIETGFLKSQVMQKAGGSENKLTVYYELIGSQIDKKALEKYWESPLFEMFLLDEKSGAKDIIRTIRLSDLSAVEQDIYYLDDAFSAAVKPSFSSSPVFSAEGVPASKKDISDIQILVLNPDKESMAKTKSRFSPEDVPLLVSDFALYNAYPNPFNPVTHLRFDLPDNGNVKLTVYNINGRKVRQLVSGWQNAGVYEVLFDGTGLASGVYFYRLESGNFVQTKRMLLIK
jgi:hypothetical protein